MQVADPIDGATRTRPVRSGSLPTPVTTLEAIDMEVAVDEPTSGRAGRLPKRCYRGEKVCQHGSYASWSKFLTTVSAVASRSRTHPLNRSDVSEAFEGVDNVWNRKLRSLRLFLRENISTSFDLRWVLGTVATSALAEMF